MRKQIIYQAVTAAELPFTEWLDIQTLAKVELSSEEELSPIEAAFTQGQSPGWRASQSGEQVIRLLFDDVQHIRRIQLEFQEDQWPRTQEFVLRWSSDGGLSYQEIVRQQFNFSTPDVSREREDYSVDLVALTTLELRIIPDISGGDARASLVQLRIA